MEWIKEDFKIRYLIYRFNKIMFNSNIIKARFFFKFKHKGKIFTIYLYDKMLKQVYIRDWTIEKIDEEVFLNIINGLAKWCNGEDFRYVGFEDFEY